MVSRAEWSVSTMYSWPRAIAVRGHLLDRRSPVAPRRVGVAVAAQGVAVALALRRDRHHRLGRELGEVGRLASPRQRLGDQPRRGRADAGELGERSRRGPLLELAGGQLADDLAGPHERLGLEPVSWARSR